MKKETLTIGELEKAAKAMEKLREWQFIVTIKKYFPFIRIERANIIYQYPYKSELGDAINKIVEKELKK